MDSGLYRAMQDLIKKECCNHMSGECVPRSRPCEMLSVNLSSGETPKYKMCSWFKTAVLPADDQLLSRFVASSAEDSLTIKECSLCGKEFIPDDGRQTMCKKCRAMDGKRKNVMKRVKRNVKR